MQTNQVTAHLILLTIQMYSGTSLCINPAVQRNYVKQAASNQASTNERFRSTCTYDGTPTEYANDNEKYDVSTMKTIRKIKSSATVVSVPNDLALIEKESVGIKQWTDYNFNLPKSHQPWPHKNQNKYPATVVDQSEKFFSTLPAQGKCIGKCGVKKASAVTSVLVTQNDDDVGTSHRPVLKWMIHHRRLNATRRVFTGELSENGQKLSPEIDRATGDTRNWSLKNASTSGDSRSRRIRRQLRFIPATAQLNKSPLYDRSLRPPNATDANGHLSNFDSSFIHSLLGVFDNAQPPPRNNFQRIRPHQFVVAPARYIDDVKILPTPFNFYTTVNDVRHGDTQSMKNTERNPGGFGESERVLTTGATDSEKPVEIIHNHFLPTLSSFSPSKLTNPAVNHGYEVTEADNLKNHNFDRHGESIFPKVDNLRVKPAKQPERGSSRYNAKDANYERYAAKYAFNYRVTDAESGNDFGHHETRNEQATDGNYHVRLPDGRIQKVTYHVDETGYHASVSYELDDKFVKK